MRYARVHKRQGFYVKVYIQRFSLFFVKYWQLSSEEQKNNHREINTSNPDNALAISGEFTRAHLTLLSVWEVWHYSPHCHSV